MKKICFLLVFILVFSLFGCNSPSDSSSGDTVKRYYDTRIMTDFEYTSANLCALDKTGRYAPSGDVYNGKETGIFYHLWHGVHETPGKVLNLTDIMRKNPDYLTYEYIGKQTSLPLLGRTVIRLLLLCGSVGFNPSYRTYDAYGG